MKEFLKKIDAFDKIENQDLIISEDKMYYISQAMSFLSTFLIFAQIILMVTPKIHRDLSTDHIYSLRTDLVNVSLNFLINQPCEVLHLDILDSIGHKQLLVNDTLKWRRVNQEKGFMELYNKKKQCHSCYDFYDNRFCCNGCEKLKEIYHSNNKTATPENWTQCKPENKQKFDPNEKCHVKGKISVNRVPGSFHLAIGQSIEDYGHQHILLDDYQTITFDHDIIDLRFGANIPMTSHPLRGTHIKSTGEPFATEYNLIITPIVFYADGQYIEKGFEYVYFYSMTYHLVPGIYFYYSFTPYTIAVTWQSRSFRSFLISTGGLLSGIYAIFSMVSTFLEKSDQKKKKVETKAEAVAEKPEQKVAAN